MQSISFQLFRRKIRTYCNEVVQSGTPLLISGGAMNDVVLMSKSEFNSMQETFHLLKSPKNAARLLKSIESDKKGGGKVRKLKSY